jgi:hypothetical protein
MRRWASKFMTSITPHSMQSLSCTATFIFGPDSADATRATIDIFLVRTFLMLRILSHILLLIILKATEATLPPSLISERY